MNRWIAAIAVGLCGCNGCNSLPSVGPLVDTAPTDLAQQEAIIDWPPANATVNGQWTAVTGWMDPAKLAAVFVSGAPVEAFYGPTGHVGIPTVRVVVRKDGRFLAPRVPVAEGATDLTLVFATATGTTGTKVVTVRGANVASVPATLVATPPSGPPDTEITFRAHSASGKSLSWQWDFDGDGVFDSESEKAAHVFADAGLYTVLARTKENDAWLYVTAQVLIGSEPKLTDSAAVSNPSLIAVGEFKDANEDPPPGDVYGLTRYVLVADGDAVQVFDAHLKPLFTLAGFKKPNGLGTDDADRIYVADSGNNRIQRFLPTGALDLTFGTQGTFTGTKKVQLDNPRALVGLNDANNGETRAPRIAFLNGPNTLVQCQFDADLLCNLQTLPVEAKAGALLSFSTPRDVSSVAYAHTLLRYEHALLFGDLGEAQDGRPVLNGPQVTRAAVTFDWGMNRWMALDSDGKVFEGCDSGARYTVPLTKPYTALAVDVKGSYRLAGRGRDQRACLAPVVMYVGAPGTVERRQLRRPFP